METQLGPENDVHDIANYPSESQKLYHRLFVLNGFPYEGITAMVIFVALGMICGVLGLHFQQRFKEQANQTSEPTSLLGGSA